MIVEIFFWLLLSTILYTYCLYPLILVALTRIQKSRRTGRDSSELPTVSILVSVYNEAMILQDKLLNLHSINYPKEKIEFLLGSDGSTDETNQILCGAESPHLRPVIFPERRGKAAVLNDLISRARGEIVVFSDGNTIFTAETVGKLLKNFSDSSVGAVCGELILQSEKKSIGGVGESAYWTYENFLKRLESDFRTIVGATGGVYAIRRKLYRPLPTSKTIMDDFLIPLEILKAGFSVKYEPEAIAHEHSSDTVHGEFRRKVRIGAANFHGISEFYELLHPRHGFIAFALWSHKIIRWLVPFLLIVLLLSTALLAMESELYKTIFSVELGLIALAIIGFVSDRFGLRIGVLGLPYYFMAMNVALFIGFFKFLFGSQKPTWDVVR